VNKKKGMLPLLNLPTTVNYDDLGDLQKAAWDAKMVKDPKFFHDIVNMQTLERMFADLSSKLNDQDRDMIQKLRDSSEKLAEQLEHTNKLEKEVEILSSKLPERLVQVYDLLTRLMQSGSELSKRESAAALQFVREGNYELITTWIRAQRVAMCERLASKVFLKATRSGKLIPMEFDIELDMFGINVHKNRDFKRIDVGIEDQCYYSEANFVEGLSDCIDAEGTWDTFEGVVSVVYRFHDDGSTSQLFDTSYSDRDALPKGGRYVEYREDENGDEVGLGNELTVSPDESPYEIYVPKSGKDDLQVWKEWDDALKKYDDYEHIVLTPVYWVTMGGTDERMVEGDLTAVENWQNMGLGHYAIPIDLLARLVTNFETEMKKQEGRARQRR